MSQCQVYRNKETGEIEKVLAPNKEDSKLFHYISIFLRNEKMRKMRRESGKDVPVQPIDKEGALRLWSQVYTPSFKEWFGDWENNPENSSKAVDENGEPILFHHVSPNEFQEFSKSKVGETTQAELAKRGFFFTENLSGFDHLGEHQYPSFLNIRLINIVEDLIDPKDKQSLIDAKGDSENRVAKIIENSNKSYNGIRVDFLKKRMSGEGTQLRSREYIVFEPSQIKSIFNNGNFSQYSNNIYQQKTSLESSKADSSTINKVETFLKRAGIEVQKLKQIQVNGKLVDANALVDITNKLVQVVSGKENVALPEEASHILVEITKQTNPSLYRKMLNSIGDYVIYKQVIEQYKGDRNYQTPEGKPDIPKLKEEAIGKIVAEHIILNEEGSVEKSENLIKVQSWWKSVLEWFKSLFNKAGFNPFEETAKGIEKENVPTTGGVFYQLSDKQSSFLDKLKKTSLEVINKATEKGDNAYFIGDRQIKNRVTTIAKSQNTKKFGEKNPAQIYREDQLKEYGSKGHADMQHLVEKYIKEDGTVECTSDENGNRIPIVQNDDSEYVSQLQPESKTILNKLEEYIKETLSSYPEGTIFRVEQTLYDENRDLAGTMDFLAFTPEGKVDILDWKFKDLNKDKYEDIPFWNTKEWNLQMAEYKKILKAKYGVKDEDFNKTRMIPIIVDYATVNMKQEGAWRMTELSPRDIEIAPVKLKIDTKTYLLPVTESETTGNEKIDKLIQKLIHKYNDIEKSPVEEGRRDIRNLQLNSIYKAIRHLQTLQDFGPLMENVDISIQDSGILIDRYNNDVKGKELTDKELSDFLDRVREKLSLLGTYKDLHVDFYDIFENPTEEQKEMLNKIKEHSSDIAITYDKLLKINQEAIDRYAQTKSVFNILSPEKVVSNITKLFTQLSKIPTKSLELFYKVNSLAQNKVDSMYSSRVNELTNLQNGVEQWSKGKDKKEFLSLIKRSYIDANKDTKYSNELIDQYDRKFYSQLREAISKDDRAWITKNVDGDKIKVFLKEYTDERLRALEDIVFPGTKEEQSLKKAQEKEKLERLADVSTGDIFSHYYLLNKFPVDDWYSKEYKNLIKPENKPILDFYNYINTINEQARKIGYLSNKESRIFLPFMHKTFVESLGVNLGGKYGIIDNIVNSLTINENVGMYGQFDETTGQLKEQVPVYYTRKIEDEDTISEDLFKNMALYTGAVINYQYKSEIAGIAKSLYLVEKNKGALRTNKTGSSLLRDKQGELLPPIENTVNAKILWNYIRQDVYGIKYAGDDADIVMGSLGSQWNKCAKFLNNKIGSDVVPIVKEDLAARKWSLTRSLETVNNAFSLKAMGLNLATSTSVLMGGNFQLIINSGIYYTNNDLLVAGYQRASHWVNKGNTSLQLALMKKFMPISSVLQKEIDKLTINKINPASFSHLMMIMMEKADHMVQYENFLAFMNNTIVEDGKLYNARTYYRNSPEYANRYNLSQEERRSLEKGFENKIISLIKEKGLMNKISVDNKGELKIEGIDNLDNENFYKYRTLIKSIGQKATGNISPENETGARNTAIGRSIMMFKNWIPDLASERFQGVVFNSATDSYEYGRVRMATKFLTKYGLSSIANINNLLKANDEGVELMRDFYSRVKNDYKEKTNKDLEMSEAVFMDLFRRNISNNIKDLMFCLSMLGMITSLSLLKPDDDEDSQVKNRYRLTYKLLDKVRDEVTFYYNPIGIHQILNGSIFPALGIFNDAAKLITNIGEEGWGWATGNEEIEKNAHPVKYFLKAFPGTKEIVNYMPFFSESLAKDLGVHISSSNMRF